MFYKITSCILCKCIVILFFVIEYICYDDGCHLKKYAENKSRSSLTPTTHFLSDVTIVIDKMHMRGHVDPWCSKVCDPRKYTELKNVSSD